MSELELEQEQGEAIRVMSEKDRQSFLDKRLANNAKKELVLVEQLKEVRKEKKEILEEQKKMMEEKNLTWLDAWELLAEESGEEEIL